MIEIEELRFAYSDVPVIEGLDLRIEDGEFVIVAGPNGAGKTTLIHTWNGLKQPDSGRVRVNGRPIEEDLLAARQAIGLVFQNPRDMFVAPRVGADVAFGPENLGLPRAEIHRRVTDALTAVGLAGREEAAVANLSAGEQRALSIAGALAMQPDHLVLDEPFVGLDDPTRHRILDHVVDRWETGTGVVVVTHDLCDVIDVADRVIVLHDGSIVDSGGPDAVRGSLEAYGIRDPEC